jgi:hypothetical protein
MLPTLDAHCHLLATRSPEELAGCGAVLAMTLSLEEAASALERREPYVAWGVGCYPRSPKAQETFDAGQNPRTVRPWFPFHTIHARRCW